MNISFEPLDLICRPSGIWKLDAYGGPYFEHCVGIPEEKKKQMCWGTWDSNPGPNGSFTNALPAELLVLFVNKINNEYYMYNNQLCLNK